MDTDFESKTCQEEFLQQEIDRLRDLLLAIGDKAHYASTGPAVPDVLWEIRAMAYDGLDA